MGVNNVNIIDPEDLTKHYKRSVTEWQMQFCRNIFADVQFTENNKSSKPALHGSKAYTKSRKGYYNCKARKIKVRLAIKARIHSLTRRSVQRPSQNARIAFEKELSVVTLQDTYIVKSPKAAEGTFSCVSTAG